MCVGIDALASAGTGQISTIAIWWGLIWVLATYGGYRAGATWAQDPVVATRGRAPEVSSSFAQVRSRTETVPTPPDIADALKKDLASASSQNRQTRFILLLFCALLGVAAASLLRSWLPLITALLTGCLYVAALTALLPWLTRDLRRDVDTGTV